MPILDSKQQRASFLILILGVGLAIALWPFSTGLLGAPVLYIVFAPLHRRLASYMPRALAAGAIVKGAGRVVRGPGGAARTPSATIASAPALHTRPRRTA